MKTIHQRLEFYEGEVKRIKYVLKDIEKRGEEALSEFDRGRGVEWANKILKRDLDFCISKVKLLKAKIESRKKMGFFVIVEEQ